jgi:hypothetical protein
MPSYYRRYHGGGTGYRGKGYAGRWDASEAGVKAAETRKIVDSNITTSPPPANPTGAPCKLPKT